MNSNSGLPTTFWPPIWPLEQDDCVDFFVSGGPTQYLIMPTNPTAFAQLQRYSTADTFWLGHGLVMERPCIDDCLELLQQRDGFLVTRWEEYEGDLMCFRNRDLERLGNL